jgi:hypothetical protein
MRDVSIIRLLVVSLSAVYGCGDGRPARIPVAGQVLIDGQPLAGGAIRVIPEGHRPASSPIDAQGRFRLATFDDANGCVAGTHPVEVISIDSNSQTQVRTWRTPQRYAAAKTSGLTLTVTEPTENASIELKWNGERALIERPPRSQPGAKPAFEGVQ